MASPVTLELRLVADASSYVKAVETAKDTSKSFRDQLTNVASTVSGVYKQAVNQASLALNSLGLQKQVVIDKAKFGVDVFKGITKELTKYSDELGIADSKTLQFMQSTAAMIDNATSKFKMHKQQVGEIVTQIGNVRDTAAAASKSWAAFGKNLPTLIGQVTELVGLIGQVGRSVLDTVEGFTKTNDELSKSLSYWQRIQRAAAAATGRDVGQFEAGGRARFGTEAFFRQSPESQREGFAREARRTRLEEESRRRGSLTAAQYRQQQGVRAEINLRRARMGLEPEFKDLPKQTQLLEELVRQGKAATVNTVGTGL